MDRENNEKSRKTPRWRDALIVISLIGIVALTGIFITSSVIFTLGSTPAPDFVKAGDLLPDTAFNSWEYNKSAENISGNPFDIALSDKTGADRFIFSRLDAGTNFPFFALITENSSGHSSREYALLDSGYRYIAVAAWFDSKKNLLTTENELLNYIEKNGNVSRTIVDLNQELRESGDIRDNRNDAGALTQLPVTQYESDMTSGYFLVLESPAPPREGYVILYIGTTGPSELSGQSPHLKVLITRSVVRSVISGDYGTWTVRGLESTP